MLTVQEKKNDMHLENGWRILPSQYVLGRHYVWLHQDAGTSLFDVESLHKISNGDIRDEYSSTSWFASPIESREESNDFVQTEKIRPKENVNGILNKTGISLPMKEHVKCW